MKEFCDSCRRHGLKPGLYLSPWDRHEKTYGDSTAYNRYYLNQLNELLTQYGELAEIWFDGACAEGPNGRRQEYDWAAIFAMCKNLQPNAVTFGDGGSDVRWIGNERGFAGDPNWSAVDPELIRFPGDAGADRATDARARNLAMSNQLQHGESNGTVWRPGECDVSIRPGWFYHDHEDDQVRSVENLVELYFQSVGRNSFFLLNAPPTRAGLFHEVDAQRLSQFGARRKSIFANDLLAGASAKVTDRGVTITLNQPATFNILRLEEYIALGQRIKRYRVHYLGEDGQWGWLLDGDTVGHAKLDRFQTLTANALRIDVESDAKPFVLESISAFHS